MKLRIPPRTAPAPYSDEVLAWFMKADCWEDRGDPFEWSPIPPIPPATEPTVGLLP